MRETPEAATSSLAWQDGIFHRPSARLECGAALSPLVLAYSTLGTPRPDGSNAVLFLPSASGTRDWIASHTYPGGCADPQQHFIISVDALGGGDSSRPSVGSGTSFPRYTIRDNARIIHRLLTQELGLPAIKAAGGASMGAMIALELALSFPAFARGIFLWLPAARVGPLFPLFTDVLEAILELPAAQAPGASPRAAGAALMAAGLAYFPLLVSRDFLDRHSPPERQRLARSVGQAFASKWQPEDLLSRYRSLATHDVFRRGDVIDETVLGRLNARCLLMPSRSDQFFPIEQAAQLRAQLPDSLWQPIETDAGHWATSRERGSSEHTFITTTTHSFLATLRD